MKHHRILIVGAGLAGLALARALGQAGLTPELVEREAGWDIAGTGMYLPANGVRALRALGLEDAVTARAAPISHQRLLDHRGRLKRPRFHAPSGFCEPAGWAVTCSA
jgi:2-polyprenyl-6-methoxyphenol hydroxylase-like FAD-dependent oxidoreductase